jgi:hypothetical protein
MRMASWLLGLGLLASACEGDTLPPPPAPTSTSPGTIVPTVGNGSAGTTRSDAGVTPDGGASDGGATTDGGASDGGVRSDAGVLDFSFL